MNNKPENIETLSIAQKNTFLEAYAILSQKELFSHTAFKRIKKQSLCAVLYELSTNNIEIPKTYQRIKYSADTYRIILSFFIAQNIVGLALVFAGLFTSIGSFLLLDNFTDFRSSSIASISIGMLLVFYFLKKHLDLKVYERFIKCLINYSLNMYQFPTSKDKDNESNNSEISSENKTQEK